MLNFTEKNVKSSKSYLIVQALGVLMDSIYVFIIIVNLIRMKSLIKMQFSKK